MKIELKSIDLKFKMAGETYEFGFPPFLNFIEMTEKNVCVKK